MNRVEKFFSEFKNTITIISGLIIVISFFFAADNYISDKIEKKITDETYMNKLSQVLRPYAIFNEKGIITYDHGGENYIGKIDVSKDHGQIESITFTTKVFLQNPPLLIYIGWENFAQITEHIGTYQWKIRFIRPAQWAMQTSEKIEPVFLVEITR